MIHIQKIKCFVGIHKYAWHGKYHDFFGRDMVVVQCPFCLAVKSTGKIWGSE